jgi:peroxiredoxin
MKYGPAATPHVFIFDDQRVLRYAGRIDDSERASLVKTQDARIAVEALLAGKEPPVTQTKVFGCSTKWGYKAESNKQWLEKIHQQPVTVTPADAATLTALRENKSGKIRLINVWATWCGPCVNEFDDLIDTHLRFRQRDFEVITVAAQFPDEEAKVKRFLQEHHALTKNYLFGDSDKYKLIDALDPKWNGELPHTFVVMPDGTIPYRASELDFLELRRKLLPLLDKVAPWPATTAK